MAQVVDPPLLPPLPPSGRYLPTKAAAALLGQTTDTLRTTASRARKAGVELRAPAEHWPDKRSPLYDRALLERWLTDHPRASSTGERAAG